MQKFNNGLNNKDMSNTDIPNGVLCFIDISRVCITDEGYLFLLSKNLNSNIDKQTSDLSTPSYLKSITISNPFGDDKMVYSLMVPIVRLGSIYVLVTENVCVEHTSLLKHNLSIITESDGIDTIFIDFHQVIEIPPSCIDEQGVKPYIKLLESLECYEKLAHIKNSLDSFIKNL